MNSYQQLVTGLEQIPKEWALTPILDKSPLREDWQTEDVIPRDKLAELLKVGQQLWSKKKERHWHCRWTGYGLLTGERSNGLIALDVDGHTAETLLQKLSNGDIPLTPSWTSGKHGRRHLVFQAPDSLREHLRSIGFTHHALKENCTGDEQLDFRYERCQSALPPSRHPETGFYKYLNSPADTPVAPAPEWLCRFLGEHCKQVHLDRQKREEEARQKAERRQQFVKQYGDGRRPVGDHRHFENDITASTLLAAIDPNPLDWYEWRDCLLAAHHENISDTDVRDWSSQSSKHTERGFDAVWRNIKGKSGGLTAGTLWYIATTQGWQPPKREWDWFSKLKQQLKQARKSAWGFKPRTKQTQTEHQQAHQWVQLYQPGKRHETWRRAIEQGHKYILDISGTGTGKSFGIGMTSPSSFAVTKLIYLTSQQRNPSTPTLETWSNLEARHAGLVEESRPNGEIRTRRAKKGERYYEPPNCGRTELIDSLRAKNVSNADSGDRICRSCLYLEGCQNSLKSGRGWGPYHYLSNRIEVLQKGWFRAHPASLPAPVGETDEDGYDYQDAVLFWEEAAEILGVTHSVRVNEADLATVIKELALHAPEQFNQLKPVLEELDQILTGAQKQPNIYGWQYHQLKDKIGLVPEYDRDAITQVLTPNLEFLSTYIERESENVRLAEEGIAKQWLLEFLDVLSGERGHFQIKDGVMTLTLHNNRMSTIANAAKANIFSDATMTHKALALKLGCGASEILVVKEDTPPIKNLEIIQVGTLGRLGMQRREHQQKRVSAVVQQLLKTNSKAKQIDFNKFVKDDPDSGKWWTDSRGSNDFQDIDTLILVGTPTRNLTALTAEFSVLYGRVPSPETEEVTYSVLLNNELPDEIDPCFTLDVSVDVEFREFIRNQILADIHQGIGRLRATRRREQKLKLYFVSDYPLDISVTLVKASDITVEAAGKTERALLACKQAMADLKAKGVKITDQAIADVVGLSRSHISRLKKLLILLLSNPNSKMSKNVEPPPDVGEVERTVANVLTSATFQPPETVLATLDEAFNQWLQPEQWHQVWDLLKAETQILILRVLISTLPANEQYDLFQIISD